MDRAVEVVEGLQPELLARIVERVLELEPRAVAILARYLADGTPERHLGFPVDVSR